MNQVIDTIDLGRANLPVTNTVFAVRASNKPTRPSNIVENLKS